MKKSGVLNSELSRVIASLGHGDLLVIGDAGLPVPRGVACIDLAVTLGVPQLVQVLDAVLHEMQVERAFRAGEAGAIGTEIDTRVQAESISHDTFKSRCETARVIVRTGEATPYANVGLIAGVVF